MAPARLTIIALLSVAAHCVQMSRAVAQGAPGPGSPDLAAMSQVRLVGAAGTVKGMLRAGIDLTLAPGIITYWRDPGEAGVPPTIDFAKSTNVASVDVVYPVPRRIHEAGLDAIGYETHVLFPLRVKPVTAGRPVHLALALDYATCGKICVPAHASLALDLPARDDKSAALDAAEALAPRVLDPAAAAKVATLVSASDNDGRPAWIVTPDTGLAASDLFVEAPSGFYLTVRPENGAFRVLVEDHPAGATRPASLRLTIAGAKGAVEFPVDPPP